MQINSFTKTLSVLIVFIGLLQVSNAQSLVMPKVSTSQAEYWYVIKSRALITDYQKTDYKLSDSFFARGDGTNSLALDCYLVSAPVKCTDTWTDEVSKWKIVPGASKGEFGIVYKKGNKEYYLQQDMQVAPEKFLKWQFREMEAGGSSGYAISLKDGKEFHNLTLARSNNSVGLIGETNTSASLWSFVPVKPAVKPSTKTETYWYAIRNLSFDDRLNRFLSADKASGLIEGTEVPTQLWAFIPHGDGFLMKNKNGLYISMKKTGLDKMLATDNVENAAVMQVGNIYKNDRAAAKIYQGTRQSASSVLHLKDITNNFSVMSSWLVPDNASYWDIVGENDLEAMFQTTLDDKLTYASDLLKAVEMLDAKSNDVLKNQINTVAKSKSGVKSVDALAQQLDKLDNAIMTFQRSYDVSDFISTKEQPLWFFIYSNTDKYPNYADVVMSTTQMIQGHASLEYKIGKSEQMWRFEQVPNSNRVKIVNRANGLYMKSNGVVSSEGDVFYLLPLSDGSFNIQSDNAQPLGATNIGVANFPGREKSLAAWRITPVSAGDLFNISM